MNRLTLESNVGVVSPKHLSASPISKANCVPLCTQYRLHKVKSGPGFFQSNQDFASFFVRGRRLRSERARASVKERLLSRPKIKQRTSGRTDALSKCTHCRRRRRHSRLGFPVPSVIGAMQRARQGRGRATDQSLIRRLRTPERIEGRLGGKRCNSAKW